MTAKSNERLNQIRQRVANRDDSNALESACGEYNCTCHYDIDFLLSLLDSQAAGTAQPVGWISCGLRHGHDRIVDIVFENAECAKAFIDGVEPVAGPIVAATAMRDACVEKVKRIHEGRLKDLRKLVESDEIENQDAEYERAVLFVLGNVVDELKSLTPDPKQ